jgi:glycerate 2-kinase
VNDSEARAALRKIFDAALASANPRNVLARHLPEQPRGRIIVVGAGKAAALMAVALEEAWPDAALEGAVVTRYGHAVSTSRIGVMEAGHPVPDANSESAANAMLELVNGLQASDSVIALMSGGGSSVLAKPATGLTLADKQHVSEALLASGADITEMNVVRKHLSAIKGGRLAKAALPARILTLAISDVPGDDPATIASGPTLPDPSTVSQARDIIARYRLDLTPTVESFLKDAPETPKPGAIPSNARVIATPSSALRAAAAAAQHLGLRPIVLGVLGGESRELGVEMASAAQRVRDRHDPVAPPALLISGGETVVTIGRGKSGRGGRNLEFLLSLAIALDGAPDVWAIAADTDGRDGTEDAAGAFVEPHTLSRARDTGIDPQKTLAEHDSFTLFESLGDLLVTGPTLTNVNALRAVAVF